MEHSIVRLYQSTNWFLFFSVFIEEKGSARGVKARCFRGYFGQDVFGIYDRLIELNVSKRGFESLEGETVESCRRTLESIIANTERGKRQRKAEKESIEFDKLNFVSLAVDVRAIVLCKFKH